MTPTALWPLKRPSSPSSVSLRPSCLAVKRTVSPGAIVLEGRLCFFATRRLVVRTSFLVEMGLVWTLRSSTQPCCAFTAWMTSCGLRARQLAISLLRKRVRLTTYSLR
jgi:hypothetical protein